MAYTGPARSNTAFLRSIPIKLLVDTIDSGRVFSSKFHQLDIVNANDSEPSIKKFQFVLA
jgi:hypothetical protein